MLSTLFLSLKPIEKVNFGVSFFGMVKYDQIWLFTGVRKCLVSPLPYHGGG